MTNISKRTSNVDCIRTLNDSFRSTFVGGTVLLTSGVASLDPLIRRTLLAAVRAFDTFDTDNDPHGEHDFGSIDCDGQKYFFKVEAYDRDLLYCSPDPTDPSVTSRVLTVMRADEY